MLSTNTRRYEFQTRTQKTGERCITWWEKKAAMAGLCELDTVSKQDVLILQLIQGVYDADLKRALLNKIDDDLNGLVKLACTWFNAKECSLIIERDIEKNLVANHIAYQKTPHPGRRRSRTHDKHATHTQRAMIQAPRCTRCTGCGNRHRKGNRSEGCTVINHMCFFCNERGHYARCCTKETQQACGNGETPKRPKEPPLKLLIRETEEMPPQ